MSLPHEMFDQRLLYDIQHDLWPLPGPDCDGRDQNDALSNGRVLDTFHEA